MFDSTGDTQRQTVSVSDIFTIATAGSYQFGLCANKLSSAYPDFFHRQSKTTAFAFH